MFQYALDDVMWIGRPPWHKACARILGRRAPAHRFGTSHLARRVANHTHTHGQHRQLTGGRREQDARPPCAPLPVQPAVLRPLVHFCAEYSTIACSRGLLSPSASLFGVLIWCAVRGDVLVVALRPSPPPSPYLPPASVCASPFSSSRLPVCCASRHVQCTAVPKRCARACP